MDQPVQTQDTASSPEDNALEAAYTAERRDLQNRYTEKYGVVVADFFAIHRGLIEVVGQYQGLLAESQNVGVLLTGIRLAQEAAHLLSVNATAFILAKKGWEIGPDTKPTPQQDEEVREFLGAVRQYSIDVRDLNRKYAAPSEVAEATKGDEDEPRIVVPGADRVN